MPGCRWKALAPVVEGLSGVVVGEIEAIERELDGARPGHVNRLCRVALPDRDALAWSAARPTPRRGCAPRWRRRARLCPAGGAIAAATIRGSRSEGMLCSEKELGIGEDGAGILALPADAPLGADLGDLSRPRRHHLRDRDHAEPPRRALHRGRGARSRRADRRALPLSAGDGEGRRRRGGRAAPRWRSPIPTSARGTRRA